MLVATRKLSSSSYHTGCWGHITRSNSAWCESWRKSSGEILTMCACQFCQLTWFRRAFQSFRYLHIWRSIGFVSPAIEIIYPNKSARVCNVLDKSPLIKWDWAVKVTSSIVEVMHGYALCTVSNWDAEPTAKCPNSFFGLAPLPAGRPA